MQKLLLVSVCFVISSIIFILGKFYVGGTYYAIPYPTVSRAQPAGSNTEFVSEYGRNFVNPSYEYSSMSNKTLQKYNALAYRNRNAFPDPPIPGWNTSTLDLSRKAGYTEKRRFVTSNQAVHTGARLDPRTHAGITAYETKWRRLQREK